jgi:feruloyl-CoA synthase
MKLMPNANLVTVPFCSMPSPSTDVDVTRREDGTLTLRSRIALEEMSGTICSYLPHWAREAPDRMFLAQRTNDNVWRRISYGEFWSRVRSVGQALLDRGGVAGDTLAILSGNSIENAVMQFGAMSGGLQVAPISPSYSLLPGGLSRIEEIGKVLTPKFVFAQKPDPYIQARGIPSFAQAEWVPRRRWIPRCCRSFATRRPVARLMRRSRRSDRTWSVRSCLRRDPSDLLRE